MSLIDARSFIERVATDEALRRELEEALRDNPQSFSQKVIELGGRYGLAYTRDELTHAVAEHQRTGPEELSDSQLEAVSGGSSITGWFTLLSSMADSKGQLQGELARFR